jgi:PmbA protein
MTESLVELAAEACELAVEAGASDADAYVRHGPVARVTLQRGATSEASGHVTDLALRVWRDGRAALATTNDLSSGGVGEAVREAVAGARAGVPCEPRLPGPRAVAPDGAPVRSHGGLGRAEHVDELEAAVARAAARVNGGAPILSAAYSGEQLSTVLVNTRGFRGTHRGERHQLWLWMESAAGHLILGAAGRRFADLRPEQVGEALAERARQPEPTAGTPSGSFEVLLPPAAAADLARALGALLTGDQLAGSEVLRRRLGQPLASPALTLVDDATLRDGLLSRPFDDEGTPSTRTPLLECGVFASVLHTRESAARLGDEPNGKAVRSEMWNVPSCAHSNLYVAPGDHASAELERGLDPGLAVETVRRPGRVHGGAFALVADGWWVEGGERVRRVGGVRVSLNLFELLRSITACGDDLVFSPLHHGAGGPSLLVEHMDVA